MRRDLVTALNMETDLDLIERPRDYLPPFAEQGKRFENLSRLLQELFLIICHRQNAFNEHLTLSEIMHIKRYDIVYAIHAYHNGFGKIRELFPNPPKPESYWDDMDNVSKEVRRMMDLFDQQTMLHSNQLTYSGNGWLRECILKHGGFEKMAEYVHAETNFDEVMEPQDVDGYWDEFENVYDELMTFIYDTKIDFMPSKLELLSGGYERLWNALQKIASEEHQAKLIKAATKSLEKRFSGEIRLSESEIAESGGDAGAESKDLVLFDEEYYTKEFQGELEKDLFALKESREFNRVLSELEVMKIISKAFNIPINDEFVGHCKFVKEAENEWKDFGSLAKELVAFQCFYRETCFSINREFVDSFCLPSMIDIAYCMRPDLNYAILRWHGGHNRVQNKVRHMKVVDLYHPIYGEGKSRDEMLYLEHGTIWQFKALPPPPMPDSSNLLIGKEMDAMFLPEAFPTQDMVDPTAKIGKDKKLVKRIRDKKVTLLLSQ